MNLKVLPKYKKDSRTKILNSFESSEELEEILNSKFIT